LRPERFHALAGIADNKQIRKDRHQRAFGKKSRKHCTLNRRLNFKCRFVGLNLDYGLAGGDRLALFLQPFANEAFFNRVAQLRDLNRNCHIFCPDSFALY
jgi:hypothetical protein